jgi:NAD(P)-dependent dehydrogenase (short-subunit alcohol dehydrogenase family)
VSGRLQDKVAIVTGGGSGIGAAIARALHAEGASVVVADVSGAQAEVAEQLGDRGLAVSVDVLDDAAVRAMVSASVKQFGRIDVLCSNAGLSGEIAPTADASLENWEKVLGVNARGAFLGARAAVPAMLAGGGGSIINTASIAGLVGLPALPAYAASKGAVVQLTKVIAAEYGRAGIRCNAICPGIVETPMLDALGRDAPPALEQMYSLAEQATCLGRLGRPEEIAAAAVFLASAESSFVTGAVLAVDGGYTAQ